MNEKFQESILTYFHDMQQIIEDTATELYKKGGPEAVEKYADWLVQAGIVKRTSKAEL